MTKEEREKAIDLLDNLLGMVEDNQDNDYDKALRIGIQAIKTVEDFENAQIITGGRLNGRTYAYKCGLADGIRKASNSKFWEFVKPTPKWIPCSERLPEIHNRAERYFVTLKCGDIDIAKFTECNGEHWWNFNYDDVVAWMPLPNPYQEDEPLLSYADQDTMQPAT